MDTDPSQNDNSCFKSEEHTPKNASSKLPLVHQMSLPESPHMQALSQFKVTLVSADFIVGYCSSAITSENPHEGIQPDTNEFKILSVSGFDQDNNSTSDIRAFETESMAFKPTTTSPELIKELLKDTSHILNLGPHPIGTRHFKGEPFRHHMASNEYTEGEELGSEEEERWIPDSSHELLFSSSHIKQLQKAAYELGWRRINVHLSMPLVRDRFFGHSLFVGKVESPFAATKVAEVAPMSAYFCSRVILADFLEAINDPKSYIQADQLQTKYPVTPRL
ncbi:hypothetical protein HDV05_008738 [Chytridiales sp. JEL 0842]|nr:hypothetical protein HDV05_008738 [Chytridiales sp. JEL 0842]